MAFPQLLSFVTFLFSSIRKGIYWFYLPASHIHLKAGTPHSSFPILNTLPPPPGRLLAKNQIPLLLLLRGETQVSTVLLDQNSGSSPCPTGRSSSSLKPTKCWFLISFSAFDAAYDNCFRFLTWKPVSQIVTTDTVCSVCTKLQVATHKLQTFKNQATSHFYHKSPASIKKKKIPWIWQHRAAI